MAKSVSLSVGRGEKLPVSKGAGLTAKGRAKYNKETGSKLKAPAPNPKSKAEEGRKKSGTKLCARGLSAAKGKFKIFPSAYSNGYGVQVCKGKMPGLDGKKHCSGAYC
jgi:hypothetical protein